MYFDCKLDVFIAGKLLETVNEVESINNIDQIGATCEITVPLVCRVKNEDQYLIDQPQVLFKTATLKANGQPGTTGDFVQIYAWYDGYENVPDYGKVLVFEGFILDFLEGTPLKIRCIDYIAKLREGEVNLNFKGTKKFKSVIDAILEGTGITLKKPYIDFDVENMAFANMSRAACLQLIKQQLPYLVITLFGKELYINIAKSELNSVKLRTDTNVIAAVLQKPDSAFGRFKVQLSFKKPDGTKEIYEVENSDPGGQLREVKILDLPVYKDNVKDVSLLKKISEQTMDNLQLGHYKGKITTLLYPVVDVFDVINFEDIRFKNRSAKYIVRGVVTTLNKDGFHRELSVAYLMNL